jgi:hypothetical protein
MAKGYVPNMNVNTTCTISPKCSIIPKTITKLLKIKCYGFIMCPITEMSATSVVVIMKGK